MKTLLLLSIAILSAGVVYAQSWRSESAPEPMRYSDTSTYQRDRSEDNATPWGTVESTSNRTKDKATSAPIQPATNSISSQYTVDK